jgi:acetyl-CoA C-acetyltransferase
MPEAVIVEALRSPIARGKLVKGDLTGLHSTQLLAKLQQGVIEKAGIEPTLVDEIFGGCVTQVGEHSCNVTRHAWLQRGKDYLVAGTTMDAQCGSSQQANHVASAMIEAGRIDIGIACGIEMMSHVGLGANMAAGGFFLADNWPWPDASPDQFSAAQKIAERRGTTRKECDELAFRSQQNAKRARDEGAFKNEILPIEAPVLDAEGKKTGQTKIVDTDQGIRNTTMEGLAALNPVVPGGMHTAGNSSQISDGAAAILWMSAKKAKELGLKPRARIRFARVVGTDPNYLLEGPVDATQYMLKKTGMTLNDIDLYEVNEAFASVVLSWVKVFDADVSRLNVNGGAIALGHPVGATGCRLIVTALNALEQRDKSTALISMCCGSSLGTACVIERL